jgi:hypothetical protein
MKGYEAIILRVGNYQDMFEDMIVDAAIEGFVKRSLKSEHGWDIMIDNDNKTYIMYVNFENKKELEETVNEIKSFPIEGGAVVQYENITEKLLYGSEYDEYKKTCNATQRFLKENLEIDYVLEKISSKGMESLFECELEALRAAS